MSIIIHSAKNKKGNVIEITYTEGENIESVSEVSRTFKNARPHPDLVGSMRALKVHAAILSDFLPPENVKAKQDKGKVLRPDFSDQEQKDLFTVSGLSVSDKGIILTAQRTTKRGKMMNFNTPLVNPEEEGENAYEYSEDLQEKVEKAKVEFAAFLNGKMGEDPQQSLNFDEGAE